jgi:hypothetical protein
MSMVWTWMQTFIGSLRRARRQVQTEPADARVATGAGKPKG